MVKMKTLLILLTCLFIISPNVVLSETMDDLVERVEAMLKMGIVKKGSDLLCNTTGMDCPETVDADELVERERLYYKKFNNVLFSGKVTGKSQGRIKKGKRNGPWVFYYDKEKLSSKGIFKDGKEDGPWVFYRSNGTVWELFTGTYKNGSKVSD
jgi:hypothetical protein